MRTLVSSEKLRTLFEAHRERNEPAFERAASSIISEELAANHHASATELRRALAGTNSPEQKSGGRHLEMRTVPKDRREGEDLLWMHNSAVTSEQVTLAAPTATRIARVLEEHRQRQRLLAHGYRPKSKLLFFGPPGNGKTLTAFLLAHELGLQVGVLRLSTVISSFLGDTASHLQRVFSRASAAPMVLLLDEVDALGKNRDDPNDVGELKRVVNSFLQAMDAFRSSESILIAASNHQYLLDQALWRRFDDIVPFPMPDGEHRVLFLKRLLSGIRFTGSIQQVASQMSGLSYADIERVSIEAVKTMVLENRETLSVRDIAAELRLWKAAVQGAQRKAGPRQK
jgi:SpoVK/Ycf46/Vps4 family AAA+-type ATPase